MFVVACLGGALSSLDSAVNTAFPAIIDGFDVAVSSLQWVVVSYVLTYAVLLLPFGRLADRAGHRETLVLGCVVSAGALTGCALAPTFGVFLGGRILQGVGIALVLASAPALITLSVPEHRRARSLGLFQMSLAAGFGVVLALWDWPAVYLFRVPVALGIVALATMRPAGQASPEAAGSPARSDLPGAVTLAVGLAAALLVASTGSQLGWASPSAVGLVLVAVGLLGVFVAVERRAPAPLVDLSLLPQAGVRRGQPPQRRGQRDDVRHLVVGPDPAHHRRRARHDHRRAAPGRHRPRDGGRRPARRPARGAVGHRPAFHARAAAPNRRPGGHQPCGRHHPDPRRGSRLRPGRQRRRALPGTQPQLHHGVHSPISTGCRRCHDQMMRTTGVVAGVAAANLFLVARLEARTGSRTLEEAGIEQFTPAFQDVLLAAALLCLAAAALSLLHRSRATSPEQIPVPSG